MKIGGLNWRWRLGLSHTHRLPAASTQSQGRGRSGAFLGCLWSLWSGRQTGKWQSGIVWPTSVEEIGDCPQRKRPTNEGWLGGPDVLSWKPNVHSGSLLLASRPRRGWGQVEGPGVDSTVPEEAADLACRDYQDGELAGEPGGTMLVRTVEAGACAWFWSGWLVDLHAPGQNYLQKVLPVDGQTL